MKPSSFNFTKIINKLEIALGTQHTINDNAKAKTVRLTRDNDCFVAAFFIPLSPLFSDILIIISEIDRVAIVIPNAGMTIPRIMLAKYKVIT